MQADSLPTDPSGNPFVDDSLAFKMYSFRALSRHFGIQEWGGGGGGGQEIQIFRQYFQRVEFFKIRLVV